MEYRKNIEFIDNSAANGNYICVEVDVARTLESWRESVFSFMWLTPEGEIKDSDSLSADEQPKRVAVEAAIKHGRPVQKPILGIGLQDHVEIGSGRAEFLTLASLGIKTLPVHIPQSNESDFQAFLAGVNS